MATKKHSSRRTTKREVAMNKEEAAVLMMYRDLSRWEKNSLYILLQSIAWGSLVPEKTDHYSWEKLRSRMGLPAPRNEVAHG